MLVLTFIGLLICLYIYFFKYQKKDGLNEFPEPPAYPIFGHIFLSATTKNVLKSSSYTIKKYGNTVYLRIGPSICPIERRLLTVDYKLIEFVLSKNKILTKSTAYQFLENWLGRGLLTSDGKYWKNHRKILTPTFHFEILKDFIVIFEAVGDELIKKFKNCDEQPSLDLNPFISMFTLDLLCESAMGAKMNIQTGQNSYYFESVKQMSRIVMDRSSSPIKYFNCTYWLSKDYYIQRKVLKILHNFTMDVINSKISKPIDKKTKKIAFLDLLLKNFQDENTLSINQIREEVDTLMFEGHDTTAAAICFILYCLADHPRVQEKVLQEQKELFGNEKNPTVFYAELQEMKYLECVIKECLRLYPPVPLIGRLTTEDIDFDGCLIPKNTNILIFVYGLHRNTNYFPDPEKFKPERFENFDGSFPYGYIPFSAGSRNCIGQKFAMLEMKSVISKVIRHFEIKPTVPRHELKLTMELILKSLNGVKVTLSKRL